MSDPFLDAPCYCGHTRGEHRRSGQVMTGRCLLCSYQHLFRHASLHERDLREEALRADPTHVHGPTHTAYACPGFVPFQVCDACGRPVR